MTPADMVWVRGLLLLVLLGMAAYWDGRQNRIPNWLTLSGVAVGLLLAVLPLTPAEVRSSLFLGMWICGGALLFLYLGGGVGGGDVKLGFGIGLLAGYPAVIHYLFYGALVALAMILVRLAWRGEMLAGLRLALRSKLPERQERQTAAVGDKPQEQAGGEDGQDTQEVPPTTTSFALALFIGVLWVSLMSIL